jgi:hypothetical protein
MHYDDLTPDKNYFFGIYSILLFVVVGLLVFVTLLLRKRKFPAFKWMAASFTSYTVGIFFLWAGFIEPYMTGVKGMFYQSSVAIMELCIVVGQCFFLALIAAFFDYPARMLKAILATGVIIAALVALPNNYYGPSPNTSTARISAFTRKQHGCCSRSSSTGAFSGSPFVNSTEQRTSGHNPGSSFYP